MQSYSLKVSKRPSTKIARRQRTNREIFGVVYGSGIEPIPVVGVSSEVNKTLIAAGTSRIIKLSIDDETKIDVLLKDSSNNPVTNELRHFDLLAVKKGEKINVEIPIILVGESPATKLGHVIHQLMDSVEVKTEPSDIPESIEVDISTLIEVGDSIMLNQVKIDDRVEIDEDMLDQAVVKVDAVEELVVEDLTAEVTIDSVDSEQGSPVEEGAESSATTTETKE